DLLFRFAAGLQPSGGSSDVGLLDRRAVLVANEVFHQDAQGEGQAGEIANLLLDRLQTVIGVALGTDLPRFPGLEAVGMRGGHEKVLLRSGLAKFGRKIRAGRGYRQSADAGRPTVCEIDPWAGEHAAFGAL